jgi:2-methylisocitrate lyase-like PEP mutase family enzyme
VRLTLAAGAVGINLEDSDYTRASESEPRLFPIAAAAERIAAARAAADRAGVPLVVNARTDVMWNGGAGPAAFEDAVARANAYRAAGADCLFVPGVRDVDVIRRLVRAIDGPLNVMIGAGSASAG